MLKPGGTLSFAVGNLSTAAAIGGGATGESFAAASLAGRPIMGEPGGCAGATVGADAAGGLAGCWAAAPKVNAPIKATASGKLHDLIIMFSFMRKPYPGVGKHAGDFPER